MSNFDIPLTPETYSSTDLATLQIFEKILKENVEGIIITDTHGNIEWVNNTFFLMTGHSQTAVEGKYLGFLFAGEQNVYETLSPKLDEVNHHQVETRICRNDGSEFPAALTLGVVRSDADRITHHVLEFSDITELRHAREKLLQRTKELSRSNQELEQFAYVASHDLQEPLRMIASYTQLIAQRYRGKLDADADEFIGYAVDGATRMQAIINDLLKLSRVDTHHVVFSRVNAQNALDRALANLRLVIEESGADMVCDPLPELDADVSQLTQLFQNLIANALKFRGSDSPNIQIGAQHLGEEWVFHVRDNGIGIAPEYSEKIFLMFQRLHSKKEYPGTGIGLTICKKIIEHHSGRIWVESEQGQGSTFYFSIPTTLNQQGNTA